MIACIRSDSGGALCGHEVTREDFVFTDPGCAVSNYSAGQHLRACGKCVEIARVNLEKAGVPWKGR